MKNYLDFEKEIKELEQQVDNLKSPFGSEAVSYTHLTLPTT